MKISQTSLVAFVFSATASLGSANVCDVYSGRAYGLCNEYCEAQDCPSARYETSSESIQGCTKVKENFVAATGEAYLPCECPCPDFEGLEPIDGEIFSESVYNVSKSGVVMLSVLKFAH